MYNNKLLHGPVSPLTYAVVVLGALALNLAVWSGVIAQVNNPGIFQSGAVVAGHCMIWGPGAGQAADSGSPCAGGVTPSPMTQSNDTNVTITLGGTPATSLLQAVSLTMGWSGQLAITRGGTGSATASGAATNIFPAVTRAGDIPNWSGAVWQNLAGNNSGTGVLTENASGVPAWIANQITVGGQVLALGGTAGVQGNGAKIQLSTGTPTAGHCAAFDASLNTVDGGVCGGATGANPTATASDTANNGVSGNFMRSDASPAVQKGTNAQFGLAEGDGTSLTLVAGVGTTIAATKAQQLAGSDNNVNVKPAHQQDHNSANKAAWSFTQSGTTVTPGYLYNVTSITRASGGVYNVLFTTGFATTAYACEVHFGSNTINAVPSSNPANMTVTNFQAVALNAATGSPADITYGSGSCQGLQ